MQSHENDLLINPESRQTPAIRKDAADSAGAEALMRPPAGARAPPWEGLRLHCVADIGPVLGASPRRGNATLAHRTGLVDRFRRE